MLSADLALVGSVVLAGLGLLACLTAWIDEVFPLRGLALAVLAGVLFYQAWQGFPGGPGLDDLPLAVLRLVAQVVN